MSDSHHSQSQSQSPPPATPANTAKDDVKKSFRCTHCHTAFRRSEHCIRHERTHTLEKPFACRFCACRFSRRDLVLRHERTIHRDKFPGAENQPPVKRQRRHSEISLEQRELLSSGCITLDQGRAPVPTAANLREKRRQSQPAIRTQSSLRSSMPPSPPPSAVDIQMFWDTSELFNSQHSPRGSFSSSSSGHPLTPPGSEHRASIVEHHVEQPIIPYSEPFSAPPPVECDLPVPFFPQDGPKEEFPNPFFFTPDAPSMQFSYEFMPPTFFPDFAIDPMLETMPAPAPVLEYAPVFSAPVTESARSRLLQDLSTTLPPELLSGFVLPRSDVLSRYLSAYVTSFQPLLPVLHLPTFEAGDTRAPLVLALCAVGAQYAGEVRRARGFAEWAGKFVDAEERSERVRGWPRGRREWSVLARLVLGWYAVGSSEGALVRECLAGLGRLGGWVRECEVAEGGDGGWWEGERERRLCWAIHIFTSTATQLFSLPPILSPHDDLTSLSLPCAPEIWAEPSWGSITTPPAPSPTSTFASKIHAHRELNQLYFAAQAGVLPGTSGEERKGLLGKLITLRASPVAARAPALMSPATAAPPSDAAVAFVLNYSADLDVAAIEAANSILSDEADDNEGEWDTVVAVWLSALVILRSILGKPSEEKEQKNRAEVRDVLRKAGFLREEGRRTRGRPKREGTTEEQDAVGAVVRAVEKRVVEGVSVWNVANTLLDAIRGLGQRVTAELDTAALAAKEKAQELARQATEKKTLQEMEGMGEIGKDVSALRSNAGRVTRTAAKTAEVRGGTPVPGEKKEDVKEVKEKELLVGKEEGDTEMGEAN